MKRLLLVVTSWLVLLFGGGCSTYTPSSPATPTTTETTTSACQALVTVQAALTKLAQVGTSTTVGEVKGFQQHLTIALNVLDQRLAGRDIQAMGDLKKANDQLASTLQGLPDTAPINQAFPKLVQVQTKVAQAQTATTKIATILQCPPSSEHK